MTGPDMRLAADQYFDVTSMADLRVVSTLGLSDESIGLLRDVEGVAAVMPAHEVDVLAEVEDVQYTMRVQSFDASAARASDTSDGEHAYSDDASYLNRPILVSGSWPEGPGECVLAADVVMEGDVAVGDVVTVLEGTQDIDDTLATREYTVTGFVRCSYYASPTNLGTDIARQRLDRPGRLRRYGGIRRRYALYRGVRSRGRGRRRGGGKRRLSGKGRCGRAAHRRFGPCRRAS